MRCVPVMTLRANISAAEAAAQLDVVPRGVAHAVIIHELAGEVRYHVFGIDGLRSRLAGSEAGARLVAALRLDEYYSDASGPLDSVLPVGAVVLEGLQILGVLVDDASGGVRGGPDSTDGRAEQPPGDLTFRGERRDRGAVIGGGASPEVASPTFGADGALLDDHGQRGAETEFNEGAANPGDAVVLPETMSPSDSSALFQAYPDVQAPGQVGVGEQFVVHVGFSLSAPANVVGPVQPVRLLGPKRLEFVIQLAGFGFTFPDGVEQPLIVDRDNSTSDRIEFAVRPNPAEAAAPRILEVSYEYGGVIVGRTWIQVDVKAETSPTPAPPAQGGGGGLLAPATAANGPHLSIDVFSRPGDPELQWRFHCRYPDVVRPGDVSNTVNYGSPQAFAIQVMQQVPAASSGPYVAETVRGMGDMVADALPDEFWDVFLETWRRARAASEVPQMLITISGEPWIPWELAWIDPERLDPADTLLEPAFSVGATLGQLWEVTRWTTPTRQVRHVPIPAAPPEANIVADDIAVIIGNYEGEPGINELPHAVAEGKTIAMAYGGYPLEVASEKVTLLMRCQLQRDGSEFQPTVIHFAGHGQTDVDNPQYTGLILGGGARLDPVVIRGFTLVAKQRPFVFLNACEAGVAGETLSQLGGLVGAFLAEGTRGFVAPLWKVDDVEARDIAVDFYRRTLVDGETVGAAMSEIRRRYTADSTSATALAYVFYGNPELRLQRSAS